MLILAISGSLRAASSTSAILRVAAHVAQPPAQVRVFDGIHMLPYFNPDLDRELDDPALPSSVREMRAQIATADALLFCTPEYAHGVPGVLKNALDWLVGGPEMVEKPVAVINVAPHATHAQASLAETLRTMSTRLLRDGPIAVNLPSGARDEHTLVHSDALAHELRAVLAALAAHAIETRTG